MELKTYQWIKGDRAGDVVKSEGDTILEGNIEFMIFTDGTRCNSALLGDFIMEIASDSPDDLMLMNELVPQPQVVTHPSPPPVVNNPAPKAPKELSPLVSLLSTSKKKKQKVTITIDMEVPPADLLKIVAASFEDGEQQVHEYLTNGWTPEMELAVKNQCADHIMATIFTKPKQRKNETV